MDKILVNVLASIMLLGIIIGEEKSCSQGYVFVRVSVLGAYAQLLDRNGHGIECAAPVK